VRILIVSTRLDRSETGLCQGLVAAGCKVLLATIPDTNTGELRKAGVQIVSFSVRHRLDWKAARHLAAITAEYQPDIVHAMQNKTLAVALLGLGKTRAKLVGYRGTIGHLSRWDPAAWLTYLHPRLDRIVCVSNAVRDYLLSHRIPAWKLVTIYKGHDPGWYTAAHRSELAALGVPSNALVVGFSGNMRRVKGVDVLLEAARILRDRNNLRFLLVGERRDSRLERLVAQEPVRSRTIWTGFRSDAAALTGACDMFVMPSVAREGLPKSLVEAMAQGVPPIVTAVGGMPEVVIHGQCGLVVPPKSSAALAAAISQLADNPELRTRLGAEARARIAHHFHIAHTVQGHLALYRQLVSDT